MRIATATVLALALLAVYVTHVATGVLEPPVAIAQAAASTSGSSGVTVYLERTSDRSVDVIVTADDTYSTVALRDCKPTLRYGECDASGNRGIDIMGQPAITRQYGSTRVRATFECDDVWWGDLRFEAVLTKMGRRGGTERVFGMSKKFSCRFPEPGANDPPWPPVWKTLKPEVEDGDLQLAGAWRLPHPGRFVGAEFRLRQIKPSIKAWRNWSRAFYSANPNVGILVAGRLPRRTYQYEMQIRTVFCSGTALEQSSCVNRSAYSDPVSRIVKVTLPRKPEPVSLGIEDYGTFVARITRHGTGKFAGWAGPGTVEGTIGTGQPQQKLRGEYQSNAGGDWTAVGSGEIGAERWFDNEATTRSVTVALGEHQYRAQVWFCHDPACPKPTDKRYIRTSPEISFANLPDPPAWRHAVPKINDAGAFKLEVAWTASHPTKFVGIEDRYRQTKPVNRQWTDDARSWVDDWELDYESNAQSRATFFTSPFTAYAYEFEWQLRSYYCEGVTPGDYRTAATRCVDLNSPHRSPVSETVSQLVTFDLPIKPEPVKLEIQRIDRGPGFPPAYNGRITRTGTGTYAGYAGRLKSRTLPWCRNPALRRCC